MLSCMALSSSCFISCCEMIGMEDDRDGDEGCIIIIYCKRERERERERAFFSFMK